MCIMLYKIDFTHIPKNSKNYKRYIIDNPFDKRFWEKVDKTKYCWNWTGALSGLKDDPLNRYGVIGINKRLHYAHRVSWMLTKGEIPESLHVLHKCDNIICVNPEHLFLGTQGDNNRDRTRKGRTTRGSKSWRATLTEKDVIFAKKNFNKMRIIDIAKILNVSFNTIWKIKDGHSWGWLKV